MPLKVKIAVPEVEATSKRTSPSTTATHSWRDYMPSHPITLEDALAEPPCEWLFPECTPQNCRGSGRK